MSYSRHEYPYSGGAQDFAVNFALGYIDRDDITVYVVGEVDGGGDQIFRDFTWVSDGMVRVTDAIPEGSTVVVERTVDKDTLEISVDHTGPVTRVTLVRAFKQLMMNVHELLDGRADSFTGALLDSVIAVRDAAVVAATEAVDARDAAQTAQGFSEDARDAAQTAQGSAETAASNASNSESNAATHAGTATTQAGIATNKAAEAAQHASDAGDYSSAAITARNAAQTAAGTAGTHAATATTKADEAAQSAAAALEAAEGIEGAASFETWLDGFDGMDLVAAYTAAKGGA